MTISAQPKSENQIIARPIAGGHWLGTCWHCGGDVIIYEASGGLVGRCQSHCQTNQTGGQHEQY